MSVIKKLPKQSSNYTNHLENEETLQIDTQRQTSSTTIKTQKESIELDQRPNPGLVQSHYNNPQPVVFANAFLAYCINNIINIILSIIVCYCYNNGQYYINTQDYYYPGIALWLLSYYTFTIILRYRDTDSHVFYEQIWACNFVMILSALGMFCKIPIFTSVSCVIVAVDQMCWYLEMIIFLCSGCRVYAIGVAKYLSKPTTSFAKKLTAWHHLWFLPLMLYTLDFKLIDGSFICGSILASAMTIVARMTTPFQCLSEHPHLTMIPAPHKTTLSPPDESNCNNNDMIPVKRHTLIYLNINCAYAFWEDIPVPFFHYFNHQTPFYYLPYLWLIANFLLNYPAVSLLELILLGIRNIFYQSSN